jgi:hypothetical protein
MPLLPLLLPLLLPPLPLPRMLPLPPLILVLVLPLVCRHLLRLRLHLVAAVAAEPTGARTDPVGK